MTVDVDLATGQREEGAIGRCGIATWPDVSSLLGSVAGGIVLTAEL